MSKKKGKKDDVYHTTNTIPKLYKKLSKCSAKDLDKLLEKDHQEEKTINSNLLFYHNRTNRALAETRLKQDASTLGVKKSQGLFLIRGNAASTGDFVLSFISRPNKVEHFVVTQSKPGWYSLNEEEVHQGLDGLVEHFSLAANGLPTQLTKACSGGSLPPPLSVRQGYTNILHAVVLEGKDDSLTKVLESKNCPGINSRSSEGSTPLHIAAGSGLTQAAQKLLARGAVVNALDSKGLTPLHVASARGHCAIVSVLLKGKADPQFRHPINGNVALHLAAQNNHLDCVNVLLSFNVPTWSRQYDTLATPYQLAKTAGHDECAKVIENHQPPAAQTAVSDWFHDNVDRKRASQLLNQYELKDGLFLVRKYSKDPAKFVLTYCYGQNITNLIIQNVMNRAYYIDEGPLLTSLPHLIEHYCVFPDGLEGVLTHCVKPEYEIGQGEYGSVMKGVYTVSDGTKINVAVKTLHAQYLETGKDNLIREAEVMVRCRHSCIVKLIGVCQAESLMLVQELVELGALLDYLLDYPEKISVRRDMNRWATQIACGMMYLEQEGIVHRDLATRNILLASPSQAKVADFGLSRGVGNSDYYRASKGGRWPVKWYAPESINYGTFSSASDVWSYGVTLWEMFSFGEQPYGDMTGAQVIQLIERNGRLHKPAKCPDDVYSRMLACWSYKSTDRPPFKRLFEEFNKGNNYVDFRLEGPS